MNVLELDHVFCMVTEPRRAVRRLEDDGWVLDAGQAHRGQGTRNRRLVWHDHFFELLWVTDVAEARANPLHLDRRADCSATGASPFGLAFRGRIDAPHQDEFWLYDALGLDIWVHTDNEQAPERPLVIVLQTASDQMRRRRQQMRMIDTTTHRRPGELREVRMHGPSPPSLPPYTGPPIVHTPGPHRLELVLDVDGTTRPVSDCLAIRA
jgi:glyoxalase-like protein